MEEFYNLVKEMRKAQRAYYVNFSPIKKAPKEEFEKAVDNFIKKHELEIQQRKKNEPSLF